MWACIRLCIRGRLIMKVILISGFVALHSMWYAIRNMNAVPMRSHEWMCICAVSTTPVFESIFICAAGRKRELSLFRRGQTNTLSGAAAAVVCLCMFLCGKRLLRNNAILSYKTVHRIQDAHSANAHNRIHALISLAHAHTQEQIGYFCRVGLRSIYMHYI